MRENEYAALMVEELGLSMNEIVNDGGGRKKGPIKFKDTENDVDVKEEQKDSGSAPGTPRLPGSSADRKAREQRESSQPRSTPTAASEAKGLRALPVPGGGVANGSALPVPGGGVASGSAKGSMKGGSAKGSAVGSVKGTPRTGKGGASPSSPRSGKPTSPRELLAQRAAASKAAKARAGGGNSPRSNPSTPRQNKDGKPQEYKGVAAAAGKGKSKSPKRKGEPPSGAPKQLRKEDYLD